jgi:hypothetical protein
MKQEILYTTVLTPANTATGNVWPYVQGQAEGLPKSLKIVKYPQDPGCYLIRYNESDFELNDTLHDTISDAMEQAQFEYKISKDQWVSVESA